MRRFAAAVLLASAAGFAGCERADRDALTREALAADPKFSAVLDKHRELANRIETYQRELELKRTTVEQTITQMRQDLAASTESVRSRIADTKQKLEPERKHLVQALTNAGEELKIKRAQRATLGRAMSQLRKSLRSSGNAWSDAERARQQVQLEEMLRDADRLDYEMEAIKAHVRLLKIKLLLLKI